MRRALTPVALSLLWGLLASLPAVAGHGSGGPIPGLPAPYVKRLLEEGEPVIFLDLRSAEEFRRARLPGARSLPLGELQRRHAEVPRTGRVILYCDCPAEEIQAAYRFLQEQGYRNVSFMDEGLSGWARRGYPVER